MHLFVSKCLVLSDSNEFLFDFKIEISDLVQHLTFGMRYEISLILESLGEIFNLELNSFGKELEVVEPERTIAELSQNGRLLLFNLQVDMLSLNYVVV